MSKITTPRKRRYRLIAGGLLALYLLTGAYHVYKPLPDGLDVAGPYHQADHVTFLADSTWLDDDGRQHTEREIFDQALDMIGAARSLVVADFFLLNRFAGEVDDGHRPLSVELVDGLVQRRAQRPTLDAMLLTDPFNTLYGGVRQPLFEQLEAAGVVVLETDLRALRDSNPAWSAAWRICCQWFRNSSANGWLPNPVGGPAVGLRTYLAALNFKANHRKTLVTDGPGGWRGLVTSANPHDASSRHDNVAVVFDGLAVRDLLETELAVAAFSGGAPLAAEHARSQAADAVPAAEGAGSAEIRILTESRIRTAALAMIDEARPGDRLDLLMFYLSHRGVVAALLEARDRGVELRVLLDPNQDAFGREKGGIPNRQVAMELQRAGIEVRWCNTDGEQCHGKMLLRRDRDGRALLLAGSANFTRRNLDNFNLETNVQVRAGAAAPVMAAAGAYFDTRWHNEPGRIHSLPYSAFADHSRWRYWRYRFMEMSGLSSF